MTMRKSVENFHGRKMKIILRTEADRKRSFEVLRNLPLEPVMELRVVAHKKNRSASQHRLMWLWNTIIGAELGESKEEVHERNKRRFLVPIYERDDPDYAGMIEAVREVHRHGMKAQAETMAKQVTVLTSTTKATVDQMTEFLNEIERVAASLGIMLPRPDDVYREAMAA